MRSIDRSSHHLLALINDILDFAKIEAGKMDLFLEEVDINIQVDSIVTTLQPLIERHGNRLTVQCPPRLGTVRTDPIRIRQILFNLLQNANKFTEHGQIYLTVTTDLVNRKQATPMRFVVFQVADSGIGMTVEQQQRLFQPFTQADASTTRKYGGSGLGLALSSSFCRMLGGEIQVESAVGQGSTFTVRLPVMEVG